MSDFALFTLASAGVEANQDKIKSLLNPFNRRDMEVVRQNPYFLFESHLPNSPLGGDRVRKVGDWLIAFAGDLVDVDTVPFDQIHEYCESRDRTFLDSMVGIWAFVAVNTISHELLALVDERAQRSVYYYFENGNLIVSTRLNVVSLLVNEFNPTWLYHSLFFNFPLHSVSFIKNVKRLPPATVFNVRDGRVSITAYSECFHARRPLIQGKDALHEASTLLQERVPAYFRGGDTVACALTGGWDGRTMLALAPEKQSLITYTYGCPGCSDLIGAEKTAKSAGIAHQSILFDESFSLHLKEHLLETVYLSSGEQSLLRGTLNFAYSQLFESFKPAIAISGIAFDMLFRGHAHSPDLISPDLCALFMGTKREELNFEDWSRIVDDFDLFTAEINATLDELQNLYGDFTSTEHHLSYIVYPLSNRYFAGEISLAEHYTTVRVPSWDKHIVDLAYRIAQSTLSYSQFQKNYTRGIRDEMILQSYLFVDMGSEFADLPISGIRPRQLLQSDKLYQYLRIYNALKRRIRSSFAGHNKVPLEDWSSWLFEQQADLVKSLLQSDSTRLKEYVSEVFIKRIIENRNVRILGKLLTAETVLRLLQTKWERFW